MKTGLIWHTGFVWGNIDSQFQFSHKYNSKNIAKIDGEDFDLLVCSWVRAVKWWANANPQEDYDEILRLIQYLRTVRAKKVVLISTVDVYPSPKCVDETEALDSSMPNHAYGKNRLRLEEFMKENFSDVHIVRLPGLFWNGLKKNVIFDLMHDNLVEKIVPNASFQYYFLGNIWEDLSRVIESGIPLVNFATPPIVTAEIVEKFFPSAKLGDPVETPPSYDVRTVHGAFWNQKTPYIHTKDRVFSDLASFISENTA